MKKIILIIIVCMFFITGCGSNNSNAINFNDSKLEKQIKTELNKSSLSKITSDDLDKLTNLKVNEDVTSLRGLESANNLTDLDLSNVGAKFDFNTLRTLNFITTLKIKDSKIDSFGFLRSLNELENLTINNCGFKDIRDLRQLNKLTNLDLSNNKITSLRDIDNLVSLESINLIGNNLKEIDDLNQLVYLKEVKLDTDIINANQDVVKALMTKGIIVSDK